MSVLYFVLYFRLLKTMLSRCSIVRQIIITEIWQGCETRKRPDLVHTHLRPLYAWESSYCYLFWGGQKGVDVVAGCWVPLGFLQTLYEYCLNWNLWEERGRQVLIYWRSWVPGGVLWCLECFAILILIEFWLLELMIDFSNDWLPDWQIDRSCM